MLVTNVPPTHWNATCAETNADWRRWNETGMAPNIALNIPGSGCHVMELLWEDTGECVGTGGAGRGARHLSKAPGQRSASVPSDTQNNFSPPTAASAAGGIRRSTPSAAE
ncbi:hypothetical protein E2C01_012255 [Portunus trituberculatus]|uniref:Uncharacterized protein n=1 Tax=Portunus trituberculatus TaxID=210409 RepID=A0A5B7DD20_PORTR|nr:hypothetical protein [Portunus trituberculatus]